MAKASGPSVPGEQLRAFRQNLLRLAAGERISPTMTARLKSEGLIGGSQAWPTVTAKGRRLMQSQEPTVDAKNERTAGLRLPDTIDRLTKPRRGETCLVEQHDAAAAQRFTRDLQLAGLQQRITQSWSLASLTLSASGPSTSARHEPASMLDARDRVAQACKHIGPDFSGLLIDLCLFDKSLSEIERERHWPARSGKLAIALGLKALARFYGLDQVAVGAAR